nr:MinD/ParA family protein [Paenibacillus larvae]
MDDQAARLRDLVGRRECKPAEAVRNTHILTVTSGKGGVGKSNFTLNFALSLVKRGYQVLVFDADIGLANIDVLLGTQAPYNLYHLLIGEKKIQEIIHEGPYGLRLVAGGSGFHDLLQLTEAELNDFADQVNSLYGYYDFIIFDTGAGLSKETLKFILAAQETIVVTTPEPTSITDAYAIIKMIHQLEHKVSFKLVINRVSSFREEGRRQIKSHWWRNDFYICRFLPLVFGRRYPCKQGCKKTDPFFGGVPECFGFQRLGVSCGPVFERS